MRLFLCEKPSQAHDIAAVMDPSAQVDKRANCITTSQGTITWASGHLLELQEPNEIDPKYKRWNPADLPIIPETFQYVPKAGSQQLLDSIGDLLQKADSVVLATDAEREGELIGRNILNYHNYEGPLERLWLKALDPESVKNALANLLPGSEKEPLYHSALTRAKSDWLVGMNASRAATARLGQPGQGVPVGRVQTPTLSLIVKRDQEIASFVPQPDSKVTIVVNSNGQDQPLEWQPVSGTPQSPQEASLAKQAAETHPLDVIRTEEPVTQAPPPLLNLSGLQQKTSQAWGMSAFDTLAIVQRLYEHHKVLSYPRSDSTVLPHEQQSQIPAVLANLAGTALGKFCPASPTVRPEVFVPDLGSAHHAIVPTTLPVNLNTLTPDERKIYLLVAKSYLASVLPDYSATKVTNSVQADGHTFSATGESPKDLGWKALSTASIPAPPVLPSGPTNLISATQTNGMTNPPKPHTDGTLIGIMANIRSLITNPKTLAVLKPNAGLGTEATRANTIEGLLKSGMLERNGPQLTSTPRARDIITKLQQAAPLLVDPSETAIWEDGLQKIEDRSLDVPRFMAGITKRVNSHVSKLLGIERVKRRPEEVTEGTPTNFKCPNSNLPIRESQRNWIFPGHPDVYCPKVLASREMSPEDYITIFNEGASPEHLSFKSKAGKPFSASLIFNVDEGKFDFDFRPRVETPSM